MTTLPAAARGGLRWLLMLAGLAAAGVVVGRALAGVTGDRMAPWIIGRAAGVAAYLLLVALVLSGLALSHPARAELRRPSVPTRIRAHIALALFTLGFTALHVGMLATDRYAGVGWVGAVVPMGATYRPAATTLGVLGVWVGVLAGGSAAIAGRLPRRAWWPLHKIAAASLVLVWLHAVLGGGDAAALVPLYVGTGALVTAVAAWRYGAARPRERR